MEPEDRVQVDQVAEDTWRAIFRYGFSEDPDVPAALGSISLGGKPVRPQEVTYFLGRERLIPTEKPGMALWREKLFALMTRNTTSPSLYFRIPSNQVVEMGMQLEI